MNKIELIMIVMSVMVLGACGSNEGAQDLHDRLVAAGKLEITEVKGLSINSYVDAGASLQEPNKMPLEAEDIGIDAGDESVTTSTEGEVEPATAIDIMKGIGTVYYVTFNEASFTVEKDGKTVLEGEWQAIDDNTISVDMNGGSKELSVELNGNKIKLTDEADEFSDAVSTSTSSGNINEPQIGDPGQNSGAYSKPSKKKCYNNWGYTYGYNPANGKYDYHYGPTQQCY